MILAILKAQWLSMRLRVGTRRAGAVFSSITSVIFYGFWAFLAWLTMLYFSQSAQSEYFVDALSSGLLFVMLYWQFAPIISASFGASLDLKKLLSYPIPHSKLFTVEVMLRIFTCGEMLLLVIGAATGLLRNPNFGAKTAIFTIGGALVFSVTNILLSAGNRNFLERIFLRSKLREVLVLLIVLISLVPQFLAYSSLKKAALLQFVPSNILWPWASAAHYMLGDRALVAAGMTIVYFSIAYAYSRWQFQRSLRFDGAVTQRRERTAADAPDGLSERLYRIPGMLFPDPIGALCEKELRTLARVPRFRLVYAMSCFFGIVLYLPQMRRPHHDGFFFQNALPIISLYGLLMLGQISYWNAFGFDRTAVQGYFSWPVKFRDALIAKNLVTALLMVPQVILTSLCAKAANLPFSPGKLVESIAVILIASMYWFSLGNICSVRLPRAMDPDKMSQMSNKMQALSIWAAPFLLLPIGLAYWARAVLQNEFVFWGILLIAAVIGGIFYYVGLDSAVNTAYDRREKFIMELSQGGSPLSVT